MQRPNSSVVLGSRIFTFLLLIVLGIWGWQQRGLLFSPGRLTAKTQPGVTLQGFDSHAEFEKECKRCHQSLETRQAFLCTDCHTNITDEINLQDGVHGQLDNVLQCEKCHPDHRGADFDPAQAALAFFDHDSTSFRLIRHQFDFDAAPLVCSKCHFSPEFDASNQACETCHLDAEIDFMSQHILDFGKDCLACHDGVDSMARFDHSLTNFVLEGVHSEAKCVGCHLDGQFQGIPTTCAECHAEPEMHAGLFLESCDTCHSVDTWSPALLENQIFEHSSQTGFSLVRHTKDYETQAMNCVSCHENGLESFEVQTCITCHRNYDSGFMDQHQVVFGADCLSCHDGFDRYSDFRHEDVFLLDGKHATTTCESCHLNHIFQGTPSDCANCHAEPLIHADWFGLKCQNCHTSEAWVPAAILRHGFPLEHGGADAASCTTCHLDKYIVYTCYGCHDHEKGSVELNHIQAGVSVDELQDCVQCHLSGTVE